MNFHSRLRKIAVALTPQQAALSYVACVRQHPSFAGYSRFFLKCWKKRPLEELCAQVRDSVERAMPDADNGEVVRAVRAAQRETVFLCFLHHHITALVTQEERILAVTSLLVDQMLLRVLSTLKKPDVGSHDEPVLKTCAIDFVQTTRSFALHLFALSEAVKLIERSYFNGASLLFDSSAATMQEVIEHLESAAGNYDALGAERYRRTNPINLQTLRTASSERAESISANLAGMAEVDAFRYLGNEKRAEEIAHRLAQRMASPRGG